MTSEIPGNGNYSDYNAQHNFEASLTQGFEVEKVRQALDLEQRVWDEKEYGSLESYEKYFEQSRIYTAFSEGECIGVCRVFKGGPELPPFFELPFYDESTREELVSGAESGSVEELGTVAVDEQKAPLGIVALDLWRLAYRHARDLDVKLWGIIMEPKRVNVMNKRYGFTFKQVGPEIDYQGGDCAVHVMDLQEVYDSMQQTAPDRFEWFVKEPLESR